MCHMADIEDKPFSRPLRGIVLKLASVLVFIVMQSLIKAADVPAGEAVFFRSAFAVPVIVVWLTWQGQLATGFRAKQPLGHIWRGLMGTIAMGLGFAGLAYLPLPEVTAIGYASPLMVVILAAMFLGEEVRLFRIASVALGLVGVLIVLSPRLSVGATAGSREAFGAMVVLGGAMFAALAQVFVRKLVLIESTTAIVFYFSMTSTVLSLVTIPFGWVWPTVYQAALLVGCGILGGIGQILLTSSYREADASLVAPFDYASMIFSLGIGLFVFGEVPTLTMLSGAALVMVAGSLGRTC
ncbi:MAG: EamA family transporter [Rhodobacterales bacterium 17-64-5]|nr:MAG: EamA family transporter [Rhodobacterales bacterium 17-64-5]